MQVHNGCILVREKGDKMTMETREEARQDTQESVILADRLPELSQEQMRRTREATPKAWAYRHMSAGIGYVWTHEDLGISLQIISDNTMRLLTVVDHPYCLLMAASMVATLEHLGLRMDLSQAILAPYLGSNEVTDSPAIDRFEEMGSCGLEVV